MTQAAQKKSATLLKNTDKFLPEVRRSTDSPFAVSAAKYHPALKKLASK